jgi:hypothetical protein
LKCKNEKKNILIYFQIKIILKHAQVILMQSFVAIVLKLSPARRVDPKPETGTGLD